MLAKTNPWVEFYRDRLNIGYVEHVKRRYADHLNAIYANIKPGDSVHEIGCGLGTVTRGLLDRAPWFASFEMSDRDPEMLNMARTRFKDGQVCWYKHDALKGPLPLSSDIVHSHGLLEHFSDDEIRWIIYNHSRSRVQIHYVPGEYPTPSFGDERLMKASQWQEICNPTKIIKFNDGLDYCLVFRKD